MNEVTPNECLERWYAGFVAECEKIHQRCTVCGKFVVAKFGPHKDCQTLEQETQG